MADWNPELYSRFEAERTRPAGDLLAQVAIAAPGEVVDLGCGPGNSTELLRARFPQARLTGVDTSDAMLTAARERLPGVAFVQADVADWVPEREPDLVFANAVLQWLPDHRALVPRLFGYLAAGGALAVQMPDNLEEPTHRLMRRVAREPAWRDRIGEAGTERARAILSLDSYYDLLAPLAARVEVWRTVYHHPMQSPAAIATWLRSTGLRPFLEPLSEPERADFLARYEVLLAEAYPSRTDGRLLLAFPRIFIVARARA